jgi:5'-nucleotidase
MLLDMPPEPGRFWNVNLPQPAEPPEEPEVVFCHVDPNPLPVDFHVADGKLHYRSRYQSRRQTAGHDVEVCFSGRIAVSLISLSTAAAYALAPALKTAT